MATATAALEQRGYTAPKLLSERPGAVSLRMDRRDGGRSRSVFVALRRADPSHDLADRLERLAWLCHPNVVELYDAGAEGDILFTVSEFVWGFSLAQVRARARIPNGVALYIAAETALALEAAHPALVHGSLDLEHVLITVEGRVKVAFPPLPPERRAEPADDLAALRRLCHELGLTLPPGFPDLELLTTLPILGSTLAEPVPHGARERLALLLAPRG